MAELAAKLRRQGNEVVEADDLESATRAIESGKFDLVIVVTEDKASICPMDGRALKLFLADPCGSLN